MKRDYHNVELVTEYAKDLTWSDRFSILTEQDYIFAKQHHRLRRLVNKVDFAITDSPLLLGLTYFNLQVERMAYPLSLVPFVLDNYGTYDNINIYLNRVKPYDPVGRNQDESQADQIAKDVKNLLDGFNVSYYEIDSDEDAPQKIYDLIQRLKIEKINKR